MAFRQILNRHFPSLRATYHLRWLILERNWTKLGPKLAGKIHVYMGGEDTFYLEGAAILLKQALAQLGSDRPEREE